MESAKQKFQEAVEKTRAPGGEQIHPALIPVPCVNVISTADAKGPPGGKMMVAQPSKNDASISNTFTTPDRTANSQPEEDKHASTGSSAHFGTSFFKPGSAT